MLKVCSRLASGSDGVTAIEYGLIAGLVAIVIIAAVTTIGSNLSTVFGAIASTLTSVVSSS